MTCDVCGLPDRYRGQGDGIGSCDCPRCDCGAASGSQFCTCEPDDVDDQWPPDDEPWPDDVIARPVETVELDGISR
ncbi:hypothetical protein EYA84_02165 [Verrucosispora sp. SN26_14.1]|uniref:hypothetical protein n=1 Tax=Verrucosispora sp. SN26_14.1 TaxID=2527879 RepID=UPI0010354E91|nr:hypothetical protein [Verrucosispora sp. SN26_14.1]TBL44269.1 hypothetical protein EYA84_02165 [Verrucosispora sp. SN26_14.1]